jgi:hypothetical protein
MPLTLNVEGADKHSLVTSLAILVLNDSKADISAANIEAVVSASGTYSLSVLEPLWRY